MNLYCLEKLHVGQILITCYLQTWKFMCSQSTSSRHLHVFLAILDGPFFMQQVLKLLSCLGATSPTWRCSCAAALSSLVRSSNTMECFLLVPFVWGCSFLITKSSPMGAGTGFICSVDRMKSCWSALL